MKTCPSVGEISTALEVISNAIGTYREDEPVTIEWSNGIVLKVKGVWQNSGTPNVSKAIARLGRKARRGKKS